VSDRSAVLDASVATLRWRYGDQDANDTQPRDRAVDRAVATAFGARAKREAVEHQRQGDYDRAQRAIQAVARRIRGYAGDDPELQARVKALERDRVAFAAPMAAHELKVQHAQTSYLLRSKDVTGRSRRAERT
jgi:hypothetical protein